MSEPVATKKDKKPRKPSVMRKSRTVVAKTKGDARPDLPPLTRYQKYTETPSSRQPFARLIPAPYNSIVRHIDPVSRQKLLDEIRRGLVNRPTWNVQTGHTVGGTSDSTYSGSWKGSARPAWRMKTSCHRCGERSAAASPIASTVGWLRMRGRPTR